MNTAEIGSLILQKEAKLLSDLREARRVLRQSFGGDRQPSSEPTLTMGQRIAFDAIKDHNEIREAVAAVAKEKTGTEAWFKAVAAANKANSDHMGEEEREGLTEFRKLAPVALRHDLAVSFISFEVENVDGVTPVDKDPKKWVAAH